MTGEAPNTAGFVMIPCATGDAVYKWFEKGKGPSQSTSPAADAWNGLSKGHVEVSDLINQAVRDSGASWEGAAADAARGATSPLATWADVTGESATSAGKSTEQIGQAYVDAKNSMSKPPVIPDKPWLNDWRPWTTDYDEAVENNQKANEQNVRAYQQYGQAVQASVNTMPTFISPTASDAGMVDDGNKKIIEKVDPPGTGDPYTPPKTGNPPGTGQPPGSDGRTDLSGWKPPGSGDDTTNPSWQNDPNDPRNRPPGIGDPNDPRNRPPTDTGIPPGGRWDPNNPNDPRNRGRLDPNDPRNRQGGPGGPGGKSGGGGAGGGRGGGMGGGGLGGAAAARAGGPGGMGSGFGGAAGVAGEGAGRGAGGFGPAGAAGAAGRGGAAGMGAGGMGGAGGKGQGDEDTEHKSASYLQETEDIFGDGTMVAPPVIGG
ncbi:PPE domain-containing protein [Lentzea sp. NPDC051838]|uniref:PPE domain-containing protein n=1 Tax=Lentzea sp. NPDC051838 TaxID=3154849 RepID=UPI003447880D